MPRTIRNEFDKKLTYENLMKAHKLGKREKDTEMKLYYLI